MFTSATVENFRGIQRLVVKEMDRVNLIIGKNNAGKTALMEALCIAGCEEGAGNALSLVQAERMPEVKEDDFEEFWRPLFRGGDVERGIRIRASRNHGPPFEMSLRLNPSSHGTVHLGGARRVSNWVLAYEIERAGNVERFEIASRGGEVSYPAIPYSGNPVSFISTGRPNLASVISSLSLLKQQGRDNEVRDLLRWLDNRIDGFEILSLSGGRASIFVRIPGEAMLLPLQVMGEGFQRCLEIGVHVAEAETLLVAIDEIESGLHHSFLEQVWKWLALASARRQIQIFATTHSEECVQAACRAFTALGDDGLRVIRLDRFEHETTASIYNRNLVEAAERMGIEIRG